jgi:hypothetical protein
MPVFRKPGNIGRTAMLPNRAPNPSNRASPERRNYIGILLDEEVHA